MWNITSSAFIRGKTLIRFSVSLRALRGENIMAAFHEFLPRNFNNV